MGTISYTSEQLHEMFEYCDGELIRRNTTSPNACKGDSAGCRQKSGYVVIRIAKKLHYRHQLIWCMLKGSRAKELDHINRIPGDDRIENLRACTRAENKWNCNNRRDNCSGHAGVSWNKRASRWLAYINKNGKRYNLGSFRELHDAVDARQLAKQKLHNLSEV